MGSNKRFKILIPDLIKSPAEIEQKILSDIGEVIATDVIDINQIDENLLNECDAIIGYDHLFYDKELISKLTKCQAIVRAGIGFDNVDLDEAKNNNIIVCNVPDYCIEEVADHAMGLLLSIVRNIPNYNDSVKENKWIRKNQFSFRFRNKTLGIIGLGRIGTAMTNKAKCLGLKVMFYDPYVTSKYGKSLNAKKVKTIKELAEKSDIITIHATLTDETKNMVNEKFFKHVKKGMILINTARGGIVDISALEKYMKNNTIAACGLDVLSREPPGNSINLVNDYMKEKEWIKGRLILTPHVAFYSHEAFDELRTKSAMEVKRILEGKKPKNCVNNFFS